MPLHLTRAAAERLGLVVKRRRKPKGEPSLQAGSSGEASLLLQIREANLPEPEREVKVCDGRRWRVDFLWRREKVACEVQGGTFWGKSDHSKGAAYESDCEKAAELNLQGYTCIAVTTRMVEDGRAIALIRRALEGGEGKE